LPGERPFRPDARGRGPGGMQGTALAAKPIAKLILPVRAAGAGIAG
jgi:hypothetical protein